MHFLKFHSNNLSKLPPGFSFNNNDKKTIFYKLRAQLLRLLKRKFRKFIKCKLSCNIATFMARNYFQFVKGSNFLIRVATFCQMNTYQHHDDEDDDQQLKRNQRKCNEAAHMQHLYQYYNFLHL